MIQSGKTPNWHQILNRKEKNLHTQGFDADSVPLIHINAQGQGQQIRLSTSYFTAELDLRYRDLIVVDPLIKVHVGTVFFIRPRALVLNVDIGGHLRAILCENQLFILEVPRIDNTMVSCFPTLDHPFVRCMCKALKKRNKGAPFELVALEGVLSTAVSILTEDVDTYEDSSLDKIEAMLRNVNRDTLEGIRSLKHGLNALVQKVGRIQMEIQEIMDDDHDMADLYLKKRRKKLGGKKPSPPSGRDVVAMDGDETPKEQRSVLNYEPTPPRRSRSIQQNFHYAWTRPSMMRRNPKSRRSRLRRALNDPDQALMQRRAAIRLKRAESPGQTQQVDPHEIEDAEDLLETVFVDLDLLSRRLDSIDGKIEDAEELLELDLDSRRNELVGLNLIVATVAMAFGFAAVVAGVFGMNLVNSDLVNDAWVLPVVLVVTLIFSAGLILGVFLYVKHRKLMFIPTSL